jgi:hypothetical protein
VVELQILSTPAVDAAAAVPLPNFAADALGNGLRRAIDEALERTVAEVRFTPHKLGVSEPQVRGK